MCKYKRITQITFLKPSFSWFSEGITCAPVGMSAMVYEASNICNLLTLKIPWLYQYHVDEQCHILYASV